VAHIVGAVNTSHVPAIGGAIARGLTQDSYWKPYFDGFAALHEWLADVKPDLVVVFYNDHGLNFFLDKMPTFAVGAAAEYRNADEGWGLPDMFAPFAGDQRASWHLIESLIKDEFDVTTCQEMLVDHAFAIPMELLWPGRKSWPVRTIPIAINTVQHPLPSAHRCFRLGRAVGRAIESYPEPLKVLVVGTGGLSHQLEGTRAGFINRPFDAMCLDALVSDPLALTRYSIADIVEQAGSQGVEVLNWLAARAALTGTVTRVHQHYHIPISNTAAGLLVLQNTPQPAA
jgi:protocatechuate 4,5-dioxygenase, beta chain